MKIRLDFVTNSSSTSYCILGVPLESLLQFDWENKTIKKTVAHACPKCKEDTVDSDDAFCRKCGTKLPAIINEGERDHEVMSRLADIIRNNGLDIHCYEESISGFVGLDITKMKEDETLAQFKKRTLALLTKYFKGDDIAIQSLVIETGEFTQHV